MAQGIRIEMGGERYGSLIVTTYAGRVKRMTMWNCECDCGKTFKASRSNLISGKHVSCGCAKQARFTDMVTRHGGRYAPEYSVWSDMKRRCSSASRGDFKYYGGRGIKVCDRWQDSFDNFISDMGARPDGMTIERVNNDGDYEPSNCIWADRLTQARNRRTA